MENRGTSENNQFEALIDVEDDIKQTKHTESTPFEGQDRINTNSSSKGKNRVAGAAISQVLTNEEVPSFADEDIAIEPTNEDSTLEGDEYLKAIHEVRHNLNPASWADEMEREDHVQLGPKGDLTKRKGVTLKWGKGIEDWALFFRSKFSTKSGDTIQYHKPSTIWSGIQTGAVILKPYIGWLICDGKEINFWRDTWATKILLMDNIWKVRNKWKYDCFKLHLHTSMLHIQTDIADTAHLSKNTMNNTIQDLKIIKALNIQCRPRQGSIIESCRWELPAPNKIKICYDGLALGNPGNAGIGIIYRDNKGDVMGTYSKAIGHTTNYIAKIMANISKLQRAVTKGWRHLWVVFN
ncbi:hypothetical protein GIB67_030943 [Kingdonia uniflora]|uniref:RNase H type-1 domain-containing protein n=1 Tax=Kingdonia uniflora TaxID=39325 RepID=A0A7J7L3M1_9MAGN|nr:hypothetical protein GIB67_030943 [Kingdonia uniflora]